MSPLNAYDNPARAKRIAYSLLRLRSRSIKEIRDRLKKRNIPEAIIKQTVDNLIRLGYLNDREFAKQWFSSRLNKPLGLRRIFFELQQKGIDKEIINQLFEENKAKYNEEETIVKLAQLKMNKMGKTDKLKAKRRIFNFLTRRGFNLDTISDVMDKL